MAATAAIVWLAWSIYRRTGDLGVILGIAALYYWSLYGAWFIVIDKTGGYSGKSYHYLESKLFPIDLDADYLTALALYSSFIVIVELVLLASLSKGHGKSPCRVELRHGPILFLGIAAGLASFWLIKDKLSAAWALNTSAYWYTRTQTDEWFTLHQVLNRVALIPPAIGFAALAAGNRSRLFVSRPARYALSGYAVLFAGMGAFTFVLGNKNEVFTALVAGFLGYLGASGNRGRWKAAAALGLGLWFLYAIDYFRAAPIAEMGLNVTERISETSEVARFLSSSNEAYGAHFSLYGVLATRTEPRFGYSLYALACSVIPRVFWPDRPRDIYLYYSESVGARQNQGYSIHHATGWYLSFGMLGVGLGALVMGLVWSHCINASRKLRSGGPLLATLWAMIGPWVFVAYLPPLIRAGPEGYKGFLIEAVAIPLAVLALSCRRKREVEVTRLLLIPLEPKWNPLLSR